MKHWRSHHVQGLGATSAVVFSIQFTALVPFLQIAHLLQLNLPRGSR